MTTAWVVRREHGGRKEWRTFSHSDGEPTWTSDREEACTYPSETWARMAADEAGGEAVAS